MTSLSVIIATLDRPERLSRTLETIAACDPLPDEVLVVDGDEGGSSRAAATAFAGRLPIRHITSAPGLPRQRNRGASEAGGDVIVFLDDDVDVEPDLFAVLRRNYADPTVLGVTGKVLEAEHRKVFGKHTPLRRFLPGSGSDGTFSSYGYPRRLVDRDTRRDISFMHGSCMSARSDMVREVRFDETLPGYALGEDEDFSYRLSRRGRIVYDPGAVVHHAKTGARGAAARRFNRTVVVNRHYLFRKNFPQTAGARVGFWLLIVMLVAHRLVNREWQGALGLLEGVVEVARAR